MTSSIGTAPPESQFPDELPEAECPDESTELEIPDEYQCKISFEAMYRPTLVKCGSTTAKGDPLPHCFERMNLLVYIDDLRRKNLPLMCPIDQGSFEKDEIEEDTTLRDEIRNWAVINKYQFPKEVLEYQDPPQIDKEDSDSDSDEEDLTDLTSLYGYDSLTIPAPAASYGYHLTMPAPAAPGNSIDPEAAICCCFLSCTIICTIVFAILASLAESLGYIAPAPKYIFI